VGDVLGHLTHSFSLDDDLLNEDTVDSVVLGATPSKQIELLAVSVGRKLERGGLHRTHETARVLREGLCIGLFLDFISGM